MSPTPRTLPWPRSIGVLSFFALSAVLLATATGSRAQSANGVRDGRGLFNTYCATCHGTMATGGGPLAPHLRHMPPDLTGLALANGGMFPEARVHRIIDGREVESHGNREMPVWGDAFRSTRGGHTEAAVQDRIKAILTYLASIQRLRA